MMNKTNQDRAYIMLKAARDILHKCRDSVNATDVFEETAIWDGVECDGYCLMEEIEELVEEIEDEMMANPALHGNMNNKNDKIMMFNQKKYLKDNPELIEEILGDNEEEDQPTTELSMEERLAAMDAKVESGEISCNLDNPEDCENCGS